MHKGECSGGNTDSLTNKGQQSSLQIEKTRDNTLTLS